MYPQRDQAMSELHFNMRAEHEGGLAFVAAFFKEVRPPPATRPNNPDCSFMRWFLAKW